MDRKAIAERRRNAAKCEREQRLLRQELQERKDRKTCSEAVARLAVWAQRVVADNERRGLSVGC